MQEFYNIKILVSCIFCLFLIISCSNKNNTKKEILFNKQGIVTIINSQQDEIIFDVELAEDIWQRSQGLMFRYRLESNQGMFFIFDFTDYQSFWMRNTYLSLDMIFIDENFLIVDIHENAFPLSEDAIISSHPAMYVLEVLGGTSKKKGINVGDSVVFRRD
ncbi:MAG: DUF192 domain-containing protein [Candidatus Cloacimonetes bacterium]|nr:DUF192 domain-containing protein [Candidatus Cloacimonadota bacterium]